MQGDYGHMHLVSSICTYRRAVNRLRNGGGAPLLRRDWLRHRVADRLQRLKIREHRLQIGIVQHGDVVPRHRRKNRATGTEMLAGAHRLDELIGGPPAKTRVLVRRQIRGKTGTPWS